MTRKPTVNDLLDQIFALPDEAQTEIVRTLIEGHADVDLYRADDEHHAALEVGRA